MSLLEQINARLGRESGMANHEAFSTDAANKALMDYLSGKGTAQAAAEAFRKVANEAIASGKLMAAEVSALEGYVGTAQMYVDVLGLLGDNGGAGNSISSMRLGTDELIVADDSFLDASGKVDWNKHAPNGGFKDGTKVDGQTIKEGNVIDRYGNQFGRYASPEGTTYDQRSLPYIENPNAYHKYLVLKDIGSVSIGEIAPAFNHNGGGIQYLLPYSIEYLIYNGYIKEIF